MRVVLAVLFSLLLSVSAWAGDAQFHKQFADWYVFSHTVGDMPEVVVMYIPDGSWSFDISIAADGTAGFDFSGKIHIPAVDGFNKNSDVYCYVNGETYKFPVQFVRDQELIKAYIIKGKENFAEKIIQTALQHGYFEIGSTADRQNMVRVNMSGMPDAFRYAMQLLATLK